MQRRPTTTSRTGIVMGTPSYMAPSKRGAARRSPGGRLWRRRAAPTR
jgi:hypothetical protein